MTPSPGQARVRTNQWRRLTAAYQCVRGTPKGEGYRARCQELPMLLRHCGLAEALSFLATDSDGGALLADLQTVLRWTRARSNPDETLADYVRQAPLRVYLALTAEVIAIAEAFALVADDAESRAGPGRPAATVAGGP